MALSISLMLAVDDVPAAGAWYVTALGARELWSLGSVMGLHIDGAPFFLHETTDEGFASPGRLGQTTARIEVFVDDPDSLITRAIDAGATATGAGVHERDTPWGTHRQGGFIDPFGHAWLVGDRSPLAGL